MEFIKKAGQEQKARYTDKAVAFNKREQRESRCGGIHIGGRISTCAELGARETGKSADLHFGDIGLSTDVLS